MTRRRPSAPEHVKIEHRPIDDRDIAPLLVSAVDELNRRYPEDPSDHSLDPRAEFLLALVAGAPAGCIAMVPVDRHLAEMKRLYVAPAHRGHGVARCLITRFEAHVVATGRTSVQLETGTRQPEAVALYTKLGYHPIPPYDPHVANPFSLCFSKRLSA